MKKLTVEIIFQRIAESDYILKPSQDKISLPIIRRIYKKMMYGIRFDDIKVCDGCIIDGHHRFVSSILAKIKLDEAKSSKTSATIEYKWSNVDFVEEEWDTPEKIQRLNELDAKFNDLPLEKIIELTK